MAFGSSGLSMPLGFLFAMKCLHVCHVRTVILCHREEKARATEAEGEAEGEPGPGGWGGENPGNGRSWQWHTDASPPGHQFPGQLGGSRHSRGRGQLVVQTLAIINYPLKRINHKILYFLYPICVVLSPDLYMGPKMLISAHMHV